MPGKSWDVVVVGGGLIGSSAAYHLARRGIRTLLIEQNDLASGASGANFGNIQVQDAEFGLSLELSLESYEMFAHLEAELDCEVDFRRSASLLLIENQRHGQAWSDAPPACERRGSPPNWWTGTRSAGWSRSCHQNRPSGGSITPTKANSTPLNWCTPTYSAGGSTAWTSGHTPRSRRSVYRAGASSGVDTSRGHVPAGWVALAAGAWARRLGRTAGVDLPLRWVHGEAIITEPLPPLANHAISSAAFFEETEDSEGQTVGFCMRQRPEGNVMIGEATCVTEALGRWVTATSLPAISREALRRFPALRPVRALRGWAIPVAFVPDNRPLLGAVDEVDGLLVATGFKSTIILTPLVGTLVATMVEGGEMDPRLTEFPLRAVAGV